MRLNVLILSGLIAFTVFLTLLFDTAPAPHAPVIMQPKTVVEQAQALEPLPEFSFRARDGKTYNVRDFKGQIVVLNFWASWCPPCVKEFPALIALAKAFPEKIVVIALSSDIDDAAMEKFLKTKGFEKLPENMMVALDTESLTQKQFQAYRLPETVMTDSAHIMRHKIKGADWTVPELSEKIRGLE